MLKNPRQLPVDDELRGIAREIVDQHWTIQDWAAHESGDWFQTPNYCGGFEAEDESSALDDAEAFLREELKDAALKTKNLKARANDAGHSWATIRRALKSIGAKSIKGQGEDTGWEWRLPKLPKPESNLPNSQA